MSSFVNQAEIIGKIPDHQVDVLVVLLNFNQAKYLDEAIKSVLVQELLVICE